MGSHSWGLWWKPNKLISTGWIIAILAIHFHCVCVCFRLRWTYHDASTVSKKKLVSFSSSGSNPQHQVERSLLFCIFCVPFPKLVTDRQRWKWWERQVFRKFLRRWRLCASDVTEYVGILLRNDGMCLANPRDCHWKATRNRSTNLYLLHPSAWSTQFSCLMCLIIHMRVCGCGCFQHWRASIRALDYWGLVRRLLAAS